MNFCLVSVLVFMFMEASVMPLSRVPHLEVLSVAGSQAFDPSIVRYEVAGHV